MLASTSCPDAALLQQFSEGRLTAAMMDELAEHVQSCSPCVQSLHHLTSSDVLAASLRDLHAAGSLPRFDRASAFVEQLKQAADAGRVTLPPEQGTTSSDGRFDLPTEEILRLLAPAQSSEELGRLGGHRVLAVLGVGGMGAVFRAEDETLRRPVALKVMLPTLAAIPEARRRFLREARAMAAVTHDHIVSVFGVGEESGTPYMAMPLLEGESLESRLLRDPVMAVGEVVRLGRQMALGLAAAHEKKLIHRDIKPANIWLEVLPEDALPRIKLLDFGLVRSADGNSDGRRTEEGMIMGTPLYMAPEQGGGQVDHRADLFSLGCVLYQLATGILPFKGTGVGMILYNVAMVHPPAPHTINPRVPIGLSRLIQALMAKEPQERPSSARLVAQSLEHVIAPVVKPAAKRRWVIGAAVAAAVMLLALIGLIAGVVFK